MGVDFGGVLGGLLDGYHFGFAAGMVKGADDDGLADGDVFCVGEDGLVGLVSWLSEGDGW